MAWQLIYTSAPRLLEAGRSGFGTVARHRQINPLLAAAVERFSQFSREPRLDPARVVYSHRIVAVGGGRFHVLSCVRDAGADYTGRTNHLAHHLILEPREVAALDRAGPSPADVVLAVPWRQTWDETPCWLEDDQEISIAGIAPQTSVANIAWARVAGEPAAAWLLASGEASRNACLLTPRGLDLRPLYAESLRLIPERHWQVTFITSLQPSDEPGDFRWLGVEAGSDLATSVAGGRPVLDLTAPHTLPLVELVQPVERSAAAAPSMGAATTTAANAPASRAETSTSDGKRYAIAKPPADDPFSNFKPTKRSKKPPLIGAAAVAVILVAIGGTLTYRSLLQQNEERQEVVTILQRSPYFDNATAAKEMEDVLRGLPRERLPGARKLVEMASQLATPLAKLGAPFPKEGHATDRLGALAKNAGIQDPPHSMKTLGAGLDQAAELYARFDKFQGLAAEYEALREERQNFAKLTGTLQEPAFGSLRNQIAQLAARKEIEVLHAALDAQDEPKGGVSWLRRALGNIAASDLDPAGQIRKQEIEDILNSWSAVQDDSPQAVKSRLESPGANDWKPWLKRLARARLSAESSPSPVAAKATEKPVVAAPAAKHPPTALYFAKDSESLATLTIKELSEDLKFEFSSPDGSPTKLPFKNSGKVRRDINAQNDGFVVLDQKVARESLGPKPPFAFTARESKSNAEVFSIYVGWPAAEAPLLGRIAKAPVLSGTDVVRTPVDLPRLGDPGSMLLLQTPDKFDGERAFTLASKSDGSFNAAPAVAAAKQRRDSHIAAANELSRQAAATQQAAESPEALKRKVDEYAASLKSDAAKKARNVDAKSGAELVGEFAMAVASDWIEAENSHDKPEKGQKNQKAKPPSEFEPLRERGKQLADAFKDPAKAKQQNRDLQMLVEGLQKRFRSNPHESGLRNIRSLCQTFNGILGDKSEVEAETKELRRQAEAEELKAKGIQVLPLLSQKVPAGEYILIGRARDGSEVRLYTFEAPQP